MTITTTTSQISYAGDGSTVEFAVPFVFGRSSELEVWERYGFLGTEERQIEGEDYVVRGGGGATGRPATGTVTTVGAVPVNRDIWIVRVREIMQHLDYGPGVLPERTHEEGFDQCVLRAQEQSRRLALVVSNRVTAEAHVAGGVPRAPVVDIPSSTARAGLHGGYDSSGDPVALVIPTPVAPSTAMTAFPIGQLSPANVVLGTNQHNYLYNSAFQVDQRQGSYDSGALGDGDYTRDGWYVLGESGAVDCNFSPSVLPFGSVEINPVALGGGLIAQVVEASATRQLLGGFTFSVKVEASPGRPGPKPFVFGVAEWTGEEDVTTRDFMDSYSLPYSFVANWDPVVESDELSGPGSKGTVSVSGIPSASAKNLVVYVASTFATTGNVTFSEALLVRGTQRDGAYLAPRFDQELRRCRRFYQKTFDYDTEPASSVVPGTVFRTAAAGTGMQRGDFQIHYEFGVPMVKVPSVSVMNPGAAGTLFYNFTESASGPPVSQRELTEHSVLLSPAVPRAIDGSEVLGIQIVMDASL